MMFCVGIVAGGVIAGALAHDNHSRYRDHSQYSDATLQMEIREKEEQLDRQRQEVIRLQKEVRQQYDEELEALRDNPDFNNIVDTYQGTGSESKKISTLSDHLMQHMQAKLEAELQADEKQLQEIDQIVFKITQMSLQGGEK